MTKKSIEDSTCGFCGHDRALAGPFVKGEVEGNYVFICSDCIDYARNALITEKRRTRPVNIKMKDVPTPKELYEFLNLHVIGQDHTKRILSVQVSNHYRRLIDVDQIKSDSGFPDESLADVEIEKSNILILGPTGSGKTLMAKTLAKKLDVPFCIGDATSITEAGYVGEDVENLLLKLLQAADFDIEEAQRGIIYIDEIDKIGKTGHNVSITRDVSGEGVQQSLLKLIEGTIANIAPQGGRKHPEQNYIQMDTTNILFICGGAFIGIDEIIARRLNKKSIGFGAEMDTSPEDEEKEKNELLSHVTHEDVMSFGIIPELAGRLPVLTYLEELSEEALVQVLTEPKNALLKQHQKAMLYSRVELSFDDDAIAEIAKEAKKIGTGARGLRSVVERVMTDIYFNMPKNSKGKFVVITGDAVRGESVSEYTSESAAA